MKKCINLFIVFSLLIISGCAFSAAPKSAICPPPGTEVPFSKLVTPGFAQDYVGCNVTTVAQFVAPGAGNYSVPASEGKIVFRVLPPGISGEKNPLSGEIQANFAVISKEAGDLVYNLNTGDFIKMSGGNFVNSLSSFAKLTTGSDHTIIVFESTNLSRVDTQKKSKKKNK